VCFDDLALGHFYLSLIEFLALYTDCIRLLPVCSLFRYRMLYAMKLNDSIDLV